MARKGLLHNLHKRVRELDPAHLWESARTSEAVVAFSDYRGELEQRVGDSVQRLLGSLQIVTRSDLGELEAEVLSLRKKVDNLRKQVKAQQESAS